MNDQLTRNEEDYLKAIDKLADDKGQVGTNALAKHLKLAAPSVTAMVQKLDGKGLVNYVKYGGISLTEIGQCKAIQLLRNHRLWEVFLSEHLGFAWDKVHDIAEQLEHVRSNELIARLGRFLGDPTIDPHGDPIPSYDLTIQPTEGTTFFAAKPGDSFTLVAAADNQDLLAKLNEFKVSLGSELVKVGQDKQGHQVMQVHGQSIAFSEMEAKQLHVSLSH
ncbi:MAG: metal-dependent transcriptional regulator [Schleiferiaceae bacterium]|nr:metal-dependent transcriptional regulator [Schleiferiaceae bacterium]